MVPRPRLGNATRLLHQVGLGCSRFARRYSGNRSCFPFLGLLRCFSSPGSLYPPYFVQAGVTPHDGCGVSPFGYPRIEAWSAAPRGFSQPPTSFIGFRRQGIHRWLFVAWRIIKMLVLALKFSRYRRQMAPPFGGASSRHTGSLRSQKTEQRDYPNLRNPASGLSVSRSHRSKLR